MRDFLRILHEAELPPLTREDLLESEIVAEAEIPATEYGYWITDEGKIVPVNHMHSLTLHEMGYHGDQLTALREGWIRVIVGGGWSDQLRLDIQFIVGCLTGKALSSLSRLCRAEDYVRFNVDAEWDYGTLVSTRDFSEEAGSKTFHDVASVIQFMQRCRRV